ncbi:MAG: sensor N-terminal transmembrane domain-containing protein [Methylobacteriaceae bacterium]|nr:sensor N-terminal transmembrane domain-containing protein [Methylobacteriaceae bacterium]
MNIHAGGERAQREEPGEAQPAAPAHRAGAATRFVVRLRRLRRAAVARLVSSLTRRIVFLNLGGLVALLLGFLYLNQFREGLIDARVQSLRTQGEIIAAAIAASANVETDAITLDPEKLMQLAPGESLGEPDDADQTQFSINPERIGPVLRRLVSPTRTRARIYDREAYLLLDSRSLTLRGNILRYDLPSPAGAADGRTWLEKLWAAVRAPFRRPPAPSSEDEAPAAQGRDNPEVMAALRGETRSTSFVNTRGQTIVSVTVPIQRFRVVRGALLLSTQGGDIDSIIASERWAILRVFLVSAAVMLVLSVFMAGAIAGPMRKLAEAAERVRRGVTSRQEIPDFTSRSDEIGHLSGALRDMTQALYSRIEAIERFAADVAHELKNPLTSLRSAVETLPRVRSDEARARLLEVIQHDVRRLDRLISDISDASRLDAELARGDVGEVDVAALLEAVVGLANQTMRQGGVRVRLSVAPAEGRRAYAVQGHASRLGQVVNNLLDNARSFSPAGGEVRVALARRIRADGAAGVEILVDDDGPGVPAHAFERIFERFYTDRPDQGFGQNSGLGLSISRQIVEAHGGEIAASNRPAPPGPDGEARVAGARFTVWLRAAA